MGRLVTFGEIMGRLNPHGYLRLVQSNELELSFAGGEANVAVAVANLGGEAAFVTKLPRNDLGTMVLRTLRGYGVDTRGILLGGERLGMYYVEKGASQRPSRVLYDRKNSAVAEAKRGEFDWDTLLRGADWFHFTGITPALSDELPLICLDALQTARRLGVRVSCDVNYRANLWTRERAGEVLSALMPYVDVCVAGPEDAEYVFGIHAPDGADFSAAARALRGRFGCETVAAARRGSLSASDNTWSGVLFDGERTYASREYRIHLVDRVGGGDSFVGGLIYALMNGEGPQDAVEFAAAASCLKQATEYDFSESSADDVRKLLSGDGSGRIQR